jgi:hypothetical protein
MLEIVKEWKREIFLFFLLPLLAVVSTAVEATEEEVIVTAVKLDSEEVSNLAAIGLSSVYLIHEYDEIKDEWRFVRASNEKKEKTDT